MTVLAREDVPGEKRLVAYVTARGTAALDPEELRGFLKERLPEYMLPTAFVVLERLPLTANGKVNRAALPAPDSRAYVARPYAAPEGQVEEALREIWRELLNVKRLGRDDDVFELGAHSMLVVKGLSRMSERFGVNLKVTEVYKNKTIRNLAARISQGLADEDLVHLEHEAKLDAAIIVPKKLRGAPSGAVLLTGSTGFVGRFLLAELLEKTDATVYCLIRAQSERQGLARLRATMTKWNLWRQTYERRIVVIPGDLRLPRLGVDPDTYLKLSERLDSIYHCGTSMNHLETYAMARPANVEGCRELLKMATYAKPILINYISTLGIFLSAANTVSRIVNEETPIEHEKRLASDGYTASKWVGEKLFMIARERGVPCNIFRLGLVWPDSKYGRYDELQHDYRLFKSCLVSRLGIKSYRPEFPPTPVDYVAQSIVCLARHHSGGGGTFHISSAYPIGGGLFERMNECLGLGLKLMSFNEWAREIKRLHHEGLSLPVVPLIEVYNYESVRENDTRFDYSRTHRELEGSGIVAPVLDTGLLRLSLQGMFSKESQLRHLFTEGPAEDGVAIAEGT